MAARRRLRILLFGVLCVTGAHSAAGDPPVLPPFPEQVSRVAFGSCANQEEPQPVWTAISAAKPDLFLLLGDNVYANTQDPAVFRAKYEKQASVFGFAALRASVPILATWDDNDYGMSDGGADFPAKAEAKSALFEFLGEPAASPRRAREGVYDARVFGPEGRRVQVILLDTRWFRSPLQREEKDDGVPGPYVASPDPAATVIGEAQWVWFAEQLRVPAELRIVVSSIQVVAEDHGYEKWANFPRERAKLFRTIRASRATGVVFVSGDRHLAEVSMTEEGDLGYPVYDVTASALNRSSKAWRRYETNRHRVATMNWGDNFGVIEVDWAAKDPAIRLQIRDVAGETTINTKIRLSTLRPSR